MADFYELLGVNRSASQNQIKSAYRRLARQYHPDINPEPEAATQFAQLTDAYHVLMDPQRRRLYDSEGIVMDGPSMQRAKESSAARRAYYQAQADRAVNEWLQRERLEARIRGHAVFTTVTLFITTFTVALFKPGIIELTHPLWYTIVILLFAASIFHLILILKRHFEHYTYRRNLVSRSREQREQKPFTREFALGFLVGGYTLCVGLGFLLGALAEEFTRQFTGETTLLDGVFSVLFYPPIAVLIVDTMYIVNIRMEGR